MAYSKQTRVLLGALAAIVLVIVAYDVWRPPDESAVTRPQRPAEAPPPTRRVLDKTPLLYEGEFLQNLLMRLRPSLVSAHPEPDTFAVTTNGFVVGPSLVLASLVSDAPTWRLHTADGEVADGVLVGLDAVHGLALLRTTLADSSQPIPIAGGVPLSTVEPLIGVQASATGGEIRMLLRAGSVSSFDRALASAGLRPGELAIDADGRVRAFGTATEDGVQPLFAFEIGEIAAALSTTARHPHPWLGAALQTIDEGLSVWFGEGGFVVVHVEPGSPAARAGLKAGAVLTEAHLGERVARTADGVDNLLEVGQAIEFLPAPRGRTTPKPITVKVADRQEPLPVSAHDVASLGLMPAAGQPGVAIVVAPGGPAAARGLLTGDVVEAVDLQPVTSARLLERALAARASKGAHVATVRRGLDRFFVLLGPAEVAAAAGAGGRDE